MTESTPSTCTLAHNILNFVRYSSCSEAPAAGCTLCQRKGIPILPVRYTVCEIKTHPEIPVLPDPLIHAMTSLPLNLAAQSQQQDQEATAPLNRYMLRKLRTGYLYVYDDINGGQWQCMGILPGGELVPFAPKVPLMPAELEKFACNIKGHTHLASLLTLPHAPQVRNVHVAYVEYPWSIEQIKAIEQDAALRAQSMQRFEIASTDSTSIEHNRGLLRSRDDISRYVPEYHSYQAWHQARDLTYTENATALPQEVDGDRLISAMDSVNTVPTQHQGMMMVVHDEIGVIEQLKVYRHQPHDQLKAKALARQGDKGLRELYWLQAVQRLEAGLKQAYDHKLIDIQQATSPQQYARYQQEMATLLARDGGQSFDINALSPEARAIYEQRFKTVDIELNRNRTLDELGHYYDVQQRTLLERYFRPALEQIEQALPLLDANYCDWVRHGLLAALNRHDQTHLQHAMYAVSLIADALDDGTILSSHSRALWDWLHDDSAHNGASILARGLLLNLKAHHAPYAQQFEPQSPPTPALDSLKLKQWYDLIKKGQKLYEKRGDIRSKELTSPRKAWLAGWNDFWKPYKRLQQATATSRIALWQYYSAQHYGQIEALQRTERQLGHAVRQLQISAAVEAALSNNALTEHAFYMQVQPSTAGTLYRTIESNADALTHQTPKAFQPLYMTRAFKTGGPDSPLVRGNFALKHLDDPTPITLWSATEAAPPSADAARASSAIVEQATLHHQHEQAIIDEQKKVAAAWSAGKQAVVSASMLMAAFGMLSAFQKVADKPDSLEKWWKAMGSFISFSQSVCDLTANLISARSAAVAARQPALTLGRVADGTKFTSSLLSKTAAVIGIIDGVVAFADAYRKYRHGGTSRDMSIEVGLSALSMTGAVVTLAAGSAVLVPVLLTLTILTVGLMFLLTHLVPSNIELWLRRSLYGRDQRYVPGGAFQSLEDEQAALQMVLRGVCVEFSYNLHIERTDGLPRWMPVDVGTQLINSRSGHAQFTVYYTVEALISLPKDFAHSLQIEITSRDGLDTLARYASPDTLLPRDYRGPPGSEAAVQHERENPVQQQEDATSKKIIIKKLLDAHQQQQDSYVLKIVIDHGRARDSYEVHKG